MNLQRFIAPTSREALAKARAVFGEGTLILSNRPSAQGVEVMATAEHSLAGQLSEHLDQGASNSSSLLAAIQAREADETRAPRQAPKPPMRMDDVPAAFARPLKASPRQSVAEDTEQLAMSTLSFQDYVRERMLRRRSEELPAELEADELPSFARQSRPEAGRGSQAPLPSSPTVVKHNPLRGMAVELPAEPARKPSAAAAPSNQGVMSELQSMKDLIEERFNTLAWLNQTRQHPLQSNLMIKLLRAGYSPTLARAIIERLPQTASPSDALRGLMGMLERNLRTDAKDAPIYSKGGVFALVGSTGVGKTTTAAKLAALCAREHGAGNVGLITLDTYRVGGHEQLRAYGRMLGVVAHLAHDKAALQDLLSLLSSKKMVLIDTTGVAPRDPRRDHILKVLNLPGIERLLVANAGCHGDTLDESLSAFKSTGCSQAILSKVDEAVKLGPALDALVRHQMVLRGITNGQQVPEDFERADASALIASSMRTHNKSAFDPSLLELDYFFAGNAGAHESPAHA